MRITRWNGKGFTGVEFIGLEMETSAPRFIAYFQEKREGIVGMRQYTTGGGAGIMVDVFGKAKDCEREIAAALEYARRF